VANERAVDYGDAPDGEPQSRASFAAHFTSLMPALDDWHAALEELETASQKLRDWIPQDVRRRGFTRPDYFDGTVANCFSEITVGRARRHELDMPVAIKLRCVEDVTTQEGEKHWSAHLHSGREEIKVAELAPTVDEFSEQGMTDLNRVVAGMNDDLQTCFEAIQSSQVATQLTAAQQALRTLRQPLLDQIRPQKVAAAWRFSDACPYCLVEISL
jgi:hypothetical protein